MRHAIHIVAGLFASLSLALPAHAAATSSVPEPGSLVLLSLGLAGVVIGRQASRRPPRD